MIEMFVNSIPPLAYFILAGLLLISFFVWAGWEIAAKKSYLMVIIIEILVLIVAVVLIFIGRYS